MKITILNGSPRKENTAAMAEAFAEGAIASYKNMLAFMGIEDAGVCALAGEDNKSEEKLAEIRAWAKSL